MRSREQYLDLEQRKESTIDWIVDYAAAYAERVDAWITAWGPLPSLGVPPTSDDIPRFYVPSDAACAWHHVILQVCGAPFCETLHPCQRMRLIDRLRDGRDRAHCTLLARDELRKADAAEALQRLRDVGMPTVPWQDVFGP